MISDSSPRAKVCHIIHDGSSQGGGATFSLAFFPAYAREFDTIVLTGSEGGLAEKLRERGVKTFTLPMQRPWRAILSWPAMWSLLRAERPDAVVVHGQWAGFFGSLAARWAGVKVVLYVTHFPSFYTDWDLLRIIRNRIAESVTCQNVNRVICLSSAGRYQYLLRRLAPEEKLVHIPNGLDPVTLVEKFSREELRREFTPSLAGDDPVVVSVSRLADQKRIDWLVRAWAIVEARSPNARLAIVGTGPEETGLRALARALNLRRCSFLGARPKGYRYYGAADLGVICSMYEGHPLALVEAMFLGCPMVGTSVDGIAETIVPSVTGLLVPPADPPALAEAILALLADPVGARRMGEAARQRAQQLYRFEDVLRRQVDLIKSEF